MHYLGIFRLKFEKSFVAFNARKFFHKVRFHSKKKKKKIEIKFGYFLA